MITSAQIGPDRQLASEILVLAYPIAPGLRTLADDSAAQAEAVVILKRVYRECLERGPRSVGSQRMGPASVDYVVTESAFDADIRAALRALCAPTTPSGMPVGSFPRTRPLGRTWPEGEYTA